MPELPEVETVVRDLEARVKSRKIKSFWTDTPKLIKSPGLATFKKLIIDAKILSIKRIGKNILFYLNKSNKKYVMLVHQKMTGHFLLGNWDIKKQNNEWIIKNTIRGAMDDPYNRFIRVVFYLDDKKMLAFSDLRKFAKVVLGEKEKIENLPEIKNLGPDALSKDFNVNYLYPILQRKNIPIKQMFFDQKIISGIGNIYADEILFKTKINPKKPCKDITKKETKKIIEESKKILKKAIKYRGSSTSDFRDTRGNKGNYSAFHFTYNREKKPCKKCKTPIVRIKLGQRSAYFCPKCQKEGKMYKVESNK